MSAGIGRGQMLVLDEHVATQRDKQSIESYCQLFLDYHSHNPTEDFKSNYWLTCIVVDPTVAGFTENVRLKMGLKT